MNDEKRINFREKCYSKVWFKNENIAGYIRDISESGLKIDLISELSENIGSKTNILIIPIEELKINPFDANVEIRWKKKGEFFFSIGIQIINKNDEFFQQNYKILRDYYNTLSDQQLSF